jgi:hypothetical protein
MKKLILVGTLLAAVGMPLVVLAQTAANTSLGSVTLGRNVMADGKPLSAGTYQVRLTTESPKPVAGQTPDSERYVEFLRGGKVLGREVATIVSQADIAQVADSKRQPAAGASRVELLKGEDYLRVWINRGGTNYLIHLVTAAKG